MSYIGPSNQAYDIKQYYDLGDLRSKKGKQFCVEPNSISGAIYENKDLTIFSNILKISGMEGLLSDPQANVTIFVPSDTHLKQKFSLLFFKNMDRGTARKIIIFSMLNRVIDKKLLQSSLTSYYPTKDRSHNLYVTNYCETVLQGCTRVIHWNYKVDNGMIHIVDNLLYFDDLPSVSYS